MSVDLQELMVMAGLTPEQWKPIYDKEGRGESLDCWLRRYYRDHLENFADEQGVEDGDLDDIVHDCKAEEAAAVNNDGPYSQIEYLLTFGCNIRDIVDEIQARTRSRRLQDNKDRDEEEE